MNYACDRYKGSTCSLSREFLGIENLLELQAYLLPTSITTPSLHYQKNLPPPSSLSLSLTPSSHDFITNAIGGNRPFLFFNISCLPPPAHPARFSFCYFTGFLVICNVVTSQQGFTQGFFHSLPWWSLKVKIATADSASPAMKLEDSVATSYGRPTFRPILT